MSDGPRLESTLRDLALASVYTKTVGQDSKTMWVIKPEGNAPEITTFKGDLGNKARTLYETGTVVDAQVTIVQNGKFTNYYLEKIQPSANQPAGGSVRAAAATAQAAQPTQEITFDQFAQVGNAERESIHRQTAAKVAAQLLRDGDGPPDFWANVDQLVTFFKTGNHQYAQWANQTKAEPSPPPLGTSEEDDIPFDRGSAS